MVERFLYMILLLCCTSIGMCAQQLEGRDTRGRDFWLAFPPNDHPSNVDEAALNVYLSSDVNTTATVWARTRNGTIDERTFAVDAGTVVKVDFLPSFLELRSASYPSGSTGDAEIPSPASVHVTSTDEITVYASIRELNTSDAWVVLPTDALGTEYRILSYPSDARADTVFIPLLTTAYPSQFVVVATEDSTIVDITLSTAGSRVDPSQRVRSVRLERGESYLVQAQVTVAQQNDDLTGSLIRSSRPLVVLASHRRAQVPILNDNASRDMLIEQVPAVDTWGKSFVVPPLQPPADAPATSPTSSPRLRVLAHKDATDVTISPGSIITLNGGDVADVPLTEAVSVTSSEPVLVGIIDRTANEGQLGLNRSGDPSLIIVPPQEQHLTSYRIISIEPRTVADPFYREHFITVTAPLGALITIDGQPVPALTPLATLPSYGYAHVPVASGAHVVASDSLCGVIAYGYGPAESYGYTGGMAFERLYQPTIVLRVLDLEAAPGTPGDLVVVVDSVLEQASLNALRLSRVSGTLSYDRTIFVPQVPGSPSELQRGDLAFTHTFDSLNVGDTMAVIPGTVVLGRVAVDTVTIVSTAWFDVDEKPVSPTVRTQSGVVTVTDLCDAGGRVRLFDPLATAPVVRIYDVLGRQLPSIGDGFNLVVTTLQGRTTTQQVWR